MHGVTMKFRQNIVGACVYRVSCERHYEMKEDTVSYKEEHRQAEEVNTKK